MFNKKVDTEAQTLVAAQVDFFFGLATMNMEWNIESNIACS